MQDIDVGCVGALNVMTILKSTEGQSNASHNLISGGYQLFSISSKGGYCGYNSGEDEEEVPTRDPICLYINYNFMVHTHYAKKVSSLAELVDYKNIKSPVVLYLYFFFTSCAFFLYFTQ